MYINIPEVFDFLNAILLRLTTDELSGDKCMEGCG
jgi:hypothetical protein